ncbi:Asp-tRNA(Asn)/Glu-tRNA(Gln) amidotransferase subunit GatC [Candidatus Uhrbacteria bacterium]|nr:Asp-tRNA(Asn)/Glu-tRNA(Gln) amidotransferase subunit GatC [Candidatus Uhrbacteria bacterium]
MAKLSLSDVEHIAKLARIHLTDTEQQKLVTELSSILSYIDQLKAVDTTNVPPTAQVTGLTDVLRDDVSQQQSVDVREQLLNATPKRTGDFVETKAVFE